MSRGPFGSGADSSDYLITKARHECFHELRFFLKKPRNRFFCLYLTFMSQEMLRYNKLNEYPFIKLR